MPHAISIWKPISAARMQLCCAAQLVQPADFSSVSIPSPHLKMPHPESLV